MVNKTFFAFATGKVSTEGGEAIKRYIGVGGVKVLAVNPSKKELEGIYDTTIENEPEYVGKVDINGKTYDNVRLDFIVKTDPETNNGIEMTSKVVFFIRKAYRFNRDETKIQVIDKYGRTAWVTKEQLNTHEIPVYSNGPANLDKDYRPCYVGEEDLTNFLINYLNIPSVMRYVNEKWIMSDKPEESDARLECIEKYFKGDFSELRGAIAMQPNNKVKCLFGVRNTDDGKQYQAVYNQMFLRNNVSKYDRLEKDLNERKASGAYPNTEFVVCPLKEYKVEATNFESKVDDDLPFGDAENPWGE